MKRAAPTSARRWRAGRTGLALSAVIVPGVAASHSFAPPYTLPVPFSMYAWGASAALVLSFVIVGLFAGVPRLARSESGTPARAQATSQPGVLLRLARALSLGLLGLCIASGWWGVQNPYTNFNMTFFWIVFVLAVPYLVAVLGDFYSPVNPWRVGIEALERLGLRAFAGRFVYPERWGYAPALLLYMAFIWLELFARTGPRGLANALALYTVINLVGAWAFGRDTWLSRGEFFGLFMHLLGKMSPWANGYRQAPFAGLVQPRADHSSVVLFVLFMLSSTAFDGLHATQPWNDAFWKGIYPVIAPMLSHAPGRQYAVATQAYYVWQWLSLLVSPFVYMAVYVGFVELMRRLTRSPLPLSELVQRFAFSLVPIAFVYHLTHYYTLALAQGGEIVRLVSDPLGRGWNLLGTARWKIEPLVVDVEVIWHTQVALILLGHIVSVYLAHVEALRTFGSARRAALSQLPMLVLMVLFTTMGLWILSLPLSPAA